MGIGWDVIFSWFGFSLGRFGVIPIVIFKAFLSLGECLGHLRPAWGPNVDLGPHFGGKRGLVLFWGCPGDAILRPRVAPEIPRVAKSHQKGGQRDPKEGLKDRKMRKNANHETFKNHLFYCVFCTFGGSGARKSR